MAKKKVKCVKKQKPISHSAAVRLGKDNARREKKKRRLKDIKLAVFN